MANKEKEREDNYWREFSETGVMPALPEADVDEQGELYVVLLLKERYNPLTKVLMGEILARRGKLDADGAAAQLEAAKWIRPMIFSKKRNYERKREMADSAEAFFASSANPELVKLGASVANEQKLRDWPSKAKGIYHALPESGVSVLPLMAELNQQSDAYRVLRQDVAFRGLVLFWLGALMSKMRKNASGIGLDLGRAFVRALRTDGLEEIPEPCWERQKIDPPPVKGKGYYPATIEKIAVGTYDIVKGVYAKRTGALTKADIALLEWVLGVLRQAAERLSDEWSDFRIGKLLVLMGRADEAKTLLMPVIRKKQSEFWAWDMLGTLFPESREACLAKALLCSGEEQMMVKVKRDAERMKLPVTDKGALAEIAKDATVLLWDELPKTRMAYYGISRKGRAMFSFDQGELSCPRETFPCLKNAKPGDEFLVRFTSRKADFGTAYDVKSLEPTGVRSSRVFAYAGALRLPNGSNGPGFVDHVFVSPSFLAAATGHNLVEGSPVHGFALRLAPREEPDRFGNVRTVTRTNALTIERLTGEELERYKMERS